jgi:molybdopterin-guanine dinucleotide biosynthesis protein A
MISKDHKHHQKQDYQFHPNEIGVWGIGCTALAQLYEYIKTSNASNKIGYYDVKHEFESNDNNSTLCVNNIELNLNSDRRAHQLNLFFNDADMLLINSNHHTASKMILILDGKKEFKTNESRLEKTIAIFYNEQTKTLAEELKLKLKECELIDATDFSVLDNYFKFLLVQNKPALNGLILTGGESSRMKENKSLLVYHEQAQWLHLYNLLDEKCEKTFVSCPENKASLYNEKPMITDTIIGYGPLSGILSALLQLKNKALLVLACDLPLITKETINQLIEARDPSKMATAFLNPESNFLEPLITIYEPKALAIMLTMLSQGYTCPRKMLMQNDIKVIHPENPSTLKNINFPEEKEQALEMIKKI